MEAPGGLLLAALELPWRENEPGRSCIPAGEYPARIGTYRGKYPDIELFSVPGRTHIEIHAANLPGELQGCIAVGLHFGYVHGQRAVLRSRVAVDMLVASLGGHEEITVRIEDWTT